MNQKNVKLVACALAGAVIITGSGFNTSATGVSSVLPVAGLALALGEGTSITGINMNSYSVSNNALVKSVIETNIKSPAPVTVETVLSTATQLPAAAVSNNALEEVGSETGQGVIPEVTISGNITEETEEDDTVSDNGATEEQPSKETPGADATVSGNTVEEAPATVSSNELTEEEKLFSTLVIAKVNDYVNVRDIPSEEGEILGKLYDKSVGTFVSEDNGWYQIQSGSVTGYVKKEYVVTGEAAIELAKQVGVRIATATTTLRIREEPGTDKTVLGLVGLEDDLVVLEEKDGWIKVSIEEGEGYISQEFVTLTTEFVKAESKAEEESRLAKEEADRKSAHAAVEKSSSSKSKSDNAGGSKVVNVPASSGSGAGSAVASFATQFVGNPYVYGGTSLTNGADCSGFVMSVYANYGVGLPHSSGAQRSVGSDVGGLGNAQPGDIVCYSGHVGIYIGGGNIVHASTAATGIKISNAGYRPVLSVRRVF